MIRNPNRYYSRIIRVFVNLLGSDRHRNAFAVKREGASLFSEHRDGPTGLFRLCGPTLSTRVSVLRVFYYARRYEGLGIVFVVAVTRDRTSQLCIITHRYQLCVQGERSRLRRFVRVERCLRLAIRRSYGVCRDRLKRLFSATFCC